MTKEDIRIKSFETEYTQFEGKAQEAIEYLLQVKFGRAVAVLHHKDIGTIDLWYGDDNAGLKKIANKHHEVLSDLQGIIDVMHIVTASDNRIVLESAPHRAVVSKMLGQTKTDNWLLSAYCKKDTSGGISDIDPEPHGLQNGTAPQQDVFLHNKDTHIS